MLEYAVFVEENNHYQDESERYKHSDFETYEMAVTACKKIVDEFLLQNYKPGMSAQKLYELYANFGEDPFIVPDRPASPFSAWDYAKQRCQELGKN